MCTAQLHRGPDDEGLRWEAGIGLGMRRLAIVDITGGRQPISDEDGTLWVVFNGEIYNAPELRDRLTRRGHRFRTRSDTEVVVHLYQDEGLGFADDMRGMWALAIQDTRTNSIILSRDRIGIKPLYVLEEPGRTLFASELRAFRAVATELHPESLQWDPGAAAAMLSWSYVPGSKTIYRRVRSVEPGTHEVLSSSGEPVTRRRYWQLRPNPDARSVRSMPEAAELIDAELRRAVREHLQSDVPVGAFVSGGIDSGLVAAYAADAQPGLATFSIGFDVAAFDESQHAQIIAQALGSSHSVRRMGGSDVYGALVDVLSRCDGPFGDSSLVAAFALASLASQTHKVVLSGDGGDELFAGYVKHSIVRWQRRLGSWPSFPFTAFEALLRRLPQSREFRSTNFVRKARRALGALGVPADVAYANLTRFASLYDASRLLREPPDPLPFSNWVEQVYSAAPGDDELSQTLASDIAVVLPNDMLAKVDQASMLNSLEARVPLLDHRLVEVGWSLPSRFKLGRRSGKLVLRELFRGRFPARLARRRKQGFQVPVESWLAGPLQPVLEWVFSPERLARYGLLDPRQLDAEHRRGLLIHSPLLLWNAFCLAIWCETSTAAINEGELRAILADDRRIAQATHPARSEPRRGRGAQGPGRTSADSA